jgi:valyl-tRNA synthetase
MEKQYTPAAVESKWYDVWLAKNVFRAEAKSSKKSYSIVIPPPNVTGALHMGHALNNTLQDILARYKRMDGFNVLWQPGTDHAGIATQSVVERKLAEQGMSRQQLGREKFVEKVWEWKQEYGDRIIMQLQRLGCSCDWSRTRFTMDEGLSRAVREVFVRLYKEGLIYQGTRLINWCPKLQTALADEEVENKEVAGHFWSIRYPLVDNPQRWIVVSTTRPETMFGDAAVAVHPDDARYKELIGKFVKIPMTDRIIPIIADEYADPQKGTGAVKITPAHDFNDYEVGLRHDLPKLCVMNPDATMNENAYAYAGLERFACRKKLVADLQAAGLIDAIEDRVVPVPLCYRTGDVIEPYLMNQWFVKMRPLAEPALDSVASGRTSFVPERYAKTYNAWLEPFKDWCISRQLWWGHRIPAWYAVSETGCVITAETPVFVDYDEQGAAAQAHQKLGREVVLQQEDDVLDTWFSSALWPFSTLGWPDATPELDTFYPTDVLVTARDIIYFWVARMMITGLKFMGKEPFHTVFINGTILDEKGQRMSKSKGNGIDPIDIIEQYGADAARFSLATLTSEGQDIKLAVSKFETGRNFCNKIWNAARFVLSNITEPMHFLALPESSLLQVDDRWMLSRLHRTIEGVRRALDEYRFNEAAHLLYDFFWHDFCDWYLEAKKADLYQQDDPQRKSSALNLCCYGLAHVCKLMHPLMPFISEELWASMRQLITYNGITEDELVVTASFPRTDFQRIDLQLEEGMVLIQEIITAFRTIRSENNVPPDKLGTALIVPENEHAEQWLSQNAAFIGRFSRLSSAQVSRTASKPTFAGQSVVRATQLYLEFEGLIDKTVEIERLQKELAKMHSLVEATAQRLQNPAFVDKAPADVVAREREKLEGLALNREKLQKSLAALMPQ